MFQVSFLFSLTRINATYFQNYLTRNHHPTKNQLHRLYFCILSNKNIPRDSRDTRPYLHSVQDHPWSFNGPYTALEVVLMFFAKISWFLRTFWVFLYFVFSSPTNHFRILIWSLSNCTKGPQKLASQGPFWGPFWGPWRSRRVPWALVELDNDQISGPTW